MNKRSKSNSLSTRVASARFIKSRLKSIPTMNSVTQFLIQRPKLHFIKSRLKSIPTMNSVTQILTQLPKMPVGNCLFRSCYLCSTNKRTTNGKTLLWPAVDESADPLAGN